MLCNRKRRECKDYRCDTFTFAKHYDYELPSTGNGAASSGLFATGNSPVLTSVSGGVRYLDANTLPVRWASPDVIKSTPGRRWMQQLNVDRTGSCFGTERSHGWAGRVEKEKSEVDRNRLVVDVFLPNHSGRHQTTGRTSRSVETTSIISEELGLTLSLPTDESEMSSSCTLSDEICLKVVDEAFRSIEYTL